MLTNWLTPFPTDPGAVGSDPGTFLVRWGLCPGQGGPNREVYPTHHQILPAFWPPLTHQTHHPPQPPDPDGRPDLQVRLRVQPAPKGTIIHHKILPAFWPTPHLRSGQLIWYHLSPVQKWIFLLPDFFYKDLPAKTKSYDFLNSLLLMVKNQESRVWNAI